MDVNVHMNDCRLYISWTKVYILQVNLFDLKAFIQAGSNLNQLELKVLFG